MIRHPCVLAFVCAITAFSSAHPQIAPNHAPVKDDYPEEAFIIEEISTNISFDNDGNSTREQTTRVRIRTDAGVQHWGLLNIPFQSATQTVQVDYARVRKPDGSTVLTPEDNIQDLDAAITRTAPFYSDLREKHIAIKSLAKGDVLEYQVRWRPIKPLVPGQFWTEYNFQHDAIVLSERVDIKVPADRAVKVKGPQSTQTIKTEGGSKTYSWSYSQLLRTKSPERDQKKATDAALGRTPAPDIQISSFQSWDEVGRWYWNLQKDRVQPTPAIRAKAAELTAGLKDDDARLRALYSFVSLQYRYIGISFGIGRYQPHAADDVLTNNYGDCKDKHTLLASLLQASGITIYPALISSARKLDPDIPSPAQFDHIVGYLPQGQRTLWLDTTPEVAPAGYLALPLRDKQALVMEAEKPGELITTPADPPSPGSQNFTIEGKLNQDGSLEAKVEDTIQGERAVTLRYAFRQTPQTQWKDLMQQISYALGYSGTVSDVTASLPEATSEPFHFSYSYHRKDFPDWANHQFSVPGLPFIMPSLSEDAAYPVFLGSPNESVSDSKVELPTGYKPQLPENVDLKCDFAEYQASYSQDQGVLTAKRRLLIKQREVPVTEFDDYRSFVKNLQNDVNRYVQTSSSNPVPIPAPPMPEGMPSFLRGVWQLPESDVSEANRLELSARSSIETGDRASAINSYKSAVAADPKFTRAWIELAVTYLSSGKSDSALDSLREAIRSDPEQLLPHKAYAFLLSGLRQPEAATDAWRETLKVAPEDRDANSGMGQSLLDQQRYAEAIPYLEAASKTDAPTGTLNGLGWAYLKTGQIEKGTAILDKIADANPTPETFNDISYELAEANAGLPKALEYAEKAVNAQEKESSDIDLSNLLPEDLKTPPKFAACWDTLGWVHFRLGHFEQAESYIYPAWLLSQYSTVGDHLAQIYEQEGKKDEAIRMYDLVLETHVTRDQGNEIRQRLDRLTATQASQSSRGSERMFGAAELSQLRTVKLKRLVAGSASAEFFLLFAPGPTLEDVQFVSGSAKLKSADGALYDAKFPIAFPQKSSARLVRRVIVNCSEVVGCQAVFLLPDSVTSVQ
jgi:tetratricopeptide (TPR) repeat protein